jgi:hypothetical protein
MFSVRRIAYHAVLLCGGVLIAWLLGCGLAGARAQADPTPTPPSPVAPAPQLVRLPTVVTQLVANLVTNPLATAVTAVTNLKPVLTGVRATTLGPGGRAPVPALLGPVVSLLDSTSIGGALLPPPVPILGPLVPNTSGALPVLSALSRPAGPMNASASGAGAAKVLPRWAQSPMPPAPGSVPAQPAPSELILPPGPLAPLGLPVAPIPPVDAGHGSSGAGGGPHRSDNDRELPVAGGTESQVGARSPPVHELGAPRTVADDPSFSPD